MVDKPNLESHKEGILNKLREGGAKGLNKRQLEIRSSKTLKNKALQELERDQEIANLGSAKKTRYVLKEFDTPVTIATDLESHKQDILNRLREAGAKGLSKTGLKIGKEATPKAQSLRQLEESREIANLGRANKTRYVLKEFDTPVTIAADLESHKQDILNRLREAGTKGLSKTGLKIGNESTPKAQSLRQLEETREIANLGRKGRTRYVLQEFNVPLETAYEIIEEKSANGKPILFSRTKLKELAKGCPANVAKKLDEAIDWLVKEKKLFKLTSGNTVFFMHSVSLRSLLPPEPEEKIAPPELDREQVLKAYYKVKQRVGFSSVEIYKLQQELGVPMDQVKVFLLEESRQGKVMLSTGDWTVSSEEIRSGAIYLLGKPHLLVRFKE